MCSANTYDQPKLSASVTYPVASTKVANRSLLTAKASIRYADRVTSRTGPSPSPGKASGEAEPIRNTPLGTRIIVSGRAPPLARVARDGAADPRGRVGVQQPCVVSGEAGVPAVSIR